MPSNDNDTRTSSRSWDPVADWYIGWVGAGGSEHHRKLALPAVLDLLPPLSGARILDIGCGTGALAGPIVTRGGVYTGVDTSRKLLAFARGQHARRATFIFGDATRLAAIPSLDAGSFDAAVFLLSIQDIDPLDDAVAGAAHAVRDCGSVVIVMTHPCFRVPRQSGWGWDSGRRLQYRRVDSYLTPQVVPMKAYGGGRRGATRSHHRPLADYVAALARHGLLVDTLREIAAPDVLPRGQRTKAERRASREIPLFVALRGVKR